MNSDDAYNCALPFSTADVWIDRDGAREIRDGWYFPFRCSEIESMGGSKGVIVDKRTRKVVQLGSAFSVDRDLQAFDAGYPLDSARLVVTSVTNQERTVTILQKLRISITEPEVADGITWRIAKPLSPDELRAKLNSLPADFGTIQTYYAVELLEMAKQEGHFSFELIHDIT